MAPFWTCVAIFTVSLVIAFAFPRRAQLKARAYANMAANLADELVVADCQIAAQAALIRDQRGRLAPIDRKHGPSGRFTGKAA